MSSRIVWTFSRLTLWKREARMFGTEVDFLPKRCSPDKFGTLAGEKARLKMDALPEEAGDKEENVYIDGIEGKTRLRPLDYAKMIKRQLESNDLESAIDIMEKRMLVEEKVKPGTYIFNLLISGCGQAGYTKKAFQLFNQMKKRGIRPTGGTYTSLFNACANSPWPKDGLERALHLKDLMLQKGHEINEINAHAMIKAFGRCGDIQTAFSVVDEMQRKKLKISSTTINFLLQACISEKQSGLGHSLMVWRKLIEYKLKPNLYTYNLLLRCARDCELGDPVTVYEDLKTFLPPEKETYLKFAKPELKQIEAKNDLNDALIPIQNENGTNLLSIEPQLSSVVFLDKITKNWHKLMLLGGVSGFLEIMDSSKVEPDMKTFTQLLSLLPSSRESEELLIKEMRRRKVKIDIDFFNMLIKKRNMENQYPAGREVLKMIAEENLVPNTMTFGVLALGCRNFKDARFLLYDLKKSGRPVNVQILGTLVNSGCSGWNLNMVIYIIDVLFKENIKPNNIFLRHVNAFRFNVQQEIKKKNQGEKYNPIINNEMFQKNYDDFILKVDRLNELEIEDPDNMRPYDQFKRNKNVENEK